MTDFTHSPAANTAAPSAAPQGNWIQLALRWVLFALLGAFALFYLMPLFRDGNHLAQKPG